MSLDFLNKLKEGGFYPIGSLDQISQRLPICSISEHRAYLSLLTWEEKENGSQ